MTTVSDILTKVSVNGPMFCEINNRRFTEHPAVMKAILDVIKSGGGVGLEFVSDLNQSVTISKPLDEDGKLSLRIVTQTFSYRTERWELDKFSRYLEGGFFILHNGPAEAAVRNRMNDDDVPAFWHRYGHSNAEKTAKDFKAFCDALKERFPDLDMSLEGFLKRHP